MKRLIRKALTTTYTFWQTCNGDVAYQQYLAHWQCQHATEGGQPLSRKAFFASETQRKWSGIKRCC